MRKLILGVACSAVLASAGAPTLAVAQPVAVEPGWVLTASVALPFARSARFNPVDGLVYAGTKGNAADGLYRINRFGRTTLLVASPDVAGIAIDAAGNVFFSDDLVGVIYRVPFGTTTRQSWATTFHAGDDDPTGLSIAPANHTGILSPGRGITADQGFSGLDEVWTFTTTVSSAPRVLHADNGTLIAAVDVVVGPTDVYLVDTGEAQPGAIYRVLAGGQLSALATSEPLADPVAIGLDTTGDLLVAEAALDRLVRINPLTGAVSEVISGVAFANDAYAGVGTKADGRQLYLTANGMIWVFTRCPTTVGGADDCNGNGVFDLCDLSAGASYDCNQNQRPDECDVAAGSGSNDCNFDLVPDECPQCGPVEVVFVMDTSASMDDEAAALCADLQSVTDELRSQRITLLSDRLGISANPGGAYACLTSNVIATYGTAVPGSPPAGQETLGALCTGTNEAASEDWGRATAVVAGLHPWAPGAARVVVPIADEGPYCGDPVRDPGNDRDSITHAGAVAVANQVHVSPITGTGSSATMIALAQDLASTTGGSHHTSTTPNADLAASILASVRATCAQVADCNANGIPDNCDVTSGTSADCDGDNIPDECETGVVCTDAGVPDAAAADAAAPDDASEPSDAAEPDVGLELDAAFADASGQVEDASGGDGGADDDAGAVDAAGPTDAAPAADATVPEDSGAARDASAAADAAGARDASEVADAGAPTKPGDEGGCGCSTTAETPRSSSLLGLCVGLLLAWRSRRSRVSSRR